MNKFVLVNHENMFPRTRKITEQSQEISFSFTKREGKEFTSRLDETEIFEVDFDDAETKREFYSILFKTQLKILYF